MAQTQLSKPVIAGRLLLLTGPLALALASCDSASSAPSEATALGDEANWPSFGRTPGEQHYSSLDQINTDTVGRLGLAWKYDLESENTLTEPVEADGRLFITTGHSHIRALDAVSGKLLWDYDSHTRELAGLNLRFGWGPKGLAYWKGRVLIATQDGRIIALDAATGKSLWEQRDFAAGELRYINGPPRVFDGKLIIGHGGADISAIRGYVTAYDAMSGKRLWRFYTVPGNPATDHDETTAIAAKTWKGEWWKQGGGGTAWNAFAYDPELKLVYIGVGNGYPYNQALRSPGGGDNLFLASIVAVRADTGKYVWHYQVCPGEQWDCTAVQDMTLATLNIDGKPHKVLLQAPKNGFFYVLDRATGKLISAKPFAKVTWASSIDMRTGRPVENPGIRYHGKLGMFELWPGARGAHSWLPQSYSPLTGLVYLPVIEGATLIGDEGVDLKHQPKTLGMGVNAIPDPELPGARRSFLKAWDPVAQKARWTVELPGNWPGGTMATAGNLVFQGRMDGKLAALRCTRRQAAVELQCRHLGGCAADHLQCRRQAVRYRADGQRCFGRRYLLQRQRQVPDRLSAAAPRPDFRARRQGHAADRQPAAAKAARGPNLSAEPGAGAHGSHRVRQRRLPRLPRCERHWRWFGARPQDVPLPGRPRWISCDHEGCARQRRHACLPRTLERPDRGDPAIPARPWTADWQARRAGRQVAGSQPQQRGRRGEVRSMMHDNICVGCSQARADRVTLGLSLPDTSPLHRAAKLRPVPRAD